MVRQKFSSRQAAELSARENELGREGDTEENVGNKGRWEWEKVIGE